ncbi:lipocalin family protein [Corynebacterium comes]|uniref:Outer membrane lipoprotein Blc n=1 Tax=Corynebacterium comes TaxID=2675218 RepID=A0A6B8VPS5_9CORY|nr:lipocalin family protein [Corynebacterium comes]QGU03414.1 Outer membrane lipoprotein Blc precursor [Corynebacterium comes]
MRKSLKASAALLLAAMILPASIHAAGAQDLTNGGRTSSGYADLLPAGSSSGPELSQVNYVDPEKYQGTWYQVAAVPQPYTLQCTNDTTAQYKLNEEKTALSVINSCGSQISSNSVINGTATIRDTDTNASLRVNFPGVPFQDEQGPVNYRVTYLASDYSLAIVGDPQRRSGFVLSRTQDLSPQQWSLVKTTVAERGWWDCSFLTVPMAEGRKDITPLCLL